MRNEKGMHMTPKERRPRCGQPTAAGRTPQPRDRRRAGAGPRGEPGPARRWRLPTSSKTSRRRSESEAAQVQHSLEFVDARIAQAAGDLVLYQGQLPGAQQALLDAQGRVAGAVQEVEALAARVDLAQQNKAKITQQLETDKQKIADTKKLIGQIATQAYKSGGVPSNLSLFFGSNKAAA